MKYLHLLWRNLTRKKLRTALTILCILVAFLLFGYLSAIRTAFTAGIEFNDIGGWWDEPILYQKLMWLREPAFFKAR